MLVFGLCVLFGVRGAPEAIWSIADFSIAAMTAINLCVLLLLRREAREETLRFVEKAPQECKNICKMHTDGGF